MCNELNLLPVFLLHTSDSDNSNIGTYYVYKSDTYGMLLRDLQHRLPGHLVKEFRLSDEHLVF